MAEPQRLVLPFATTGSLELFEAMPPAENGAHGDPFTNVVNVMRGSSISPLRTLGSVVEAERLSPGELRVLRYLPTNLSRPEIAGQLSLSVNTVNTHIRSIYAKLQAQDRSSAVRRARELRLLSAGLSR
jgi:LuxR family maltose regulon positive regulatory protein